MNSGDVEERVDVDKGLAEASVEILLGVPQ
jgi:hypothetical protein